MAQKLRAQYPFVRIPYYIGIQTVGGVNVTTTKSFINSGGISNCGDYQIDGAGSLDFSFAVPIRALKYQVTQRYVDTVGFYINNTFYTLTSANISTYTGTSPNSPCVPTNMGYATGIATQYGYLASQSTNLSAASDVNFTSGSTPITQTTILTATTYIHPIPFLSLFLQAKDIFMTIVQPYKDTLLCAGDSLKVAFQVTKKFAGTNSFTVELSDSNGLFPPINTTVIGSKQTDTTDTIACYIPPATLTSGKYRIRMLSSFPPLTSGDNIVNIGIGNHAPPKPSASSNSPVCLNDSIRLGATDTGFVTSYSWTGPLNFKSDLQFPVLKSTTLSNGGKYIVTAATYGCKTKDTATVTILPQPNKPTVTSNGSVCPEDTIKLFATSSSSGVSYNWTGPNSFASTSQNPIVLNASTNLAGRYISTVSWLINNCISKDSVNVTVKPLPAKPVIVSNAPICTGDSLQLSSSTTTSGVTYKWSGPGSFSSVAKDTGIGNTTTTQSGDYIVTVTLNGCISKDTETVVINSYPQNVTAGSNTPVCPGTTLNLTASSASSNVIWSWSGPGSYTAATQNASRNNMVTAWAGTYTATATLNGCSVSANTNVASYITTPTPTVSSNNPVCYGGTLNLTASTIPGAVYIWYGPNNYHSNVQNATRPNMGAADAGVYTVNANVNGCISQTALSQPISLVTGPSVSAYASPSSTICAGSNVALVAVPNNIGTNPAIYNWYKNGNNTGGTGSSYIAPAPNNGDTFYVMMTAGTACNTPIASNNVTIATIPTTPPPAAIISASPGTDVWPYLNVSFSIISLTNGGSAPTYQWQLNGKNVAGATTNKWNSTTLKDGDSVCLLVTSSDQCATPKSTLSNCLKMKIPTGVPTPKSPEGDFAVYPNPNNGEFYLTITSPRKDNSINSLSSYAPLKGGTLSVTDVAGRVIATYSITEVKTLIQLPANISSGVYIVKYTEAEGNVNVTRVVLE